MTQLVPSAARKDLFTGIAVTTLVVLAALSFRAFGAFMGLFIPLPILFYRSKLGRNSGVVILGAVCLIVMSLVGWRSVGTAAFLFEIGMVGLILPELFEMNLSVEKTVGITAAVVLFTGTVIFGLYSMVSAVSPWTMVSDYLRKSADLALAFYREMEPSADNIEALTASMEEILRAVLSIVPALMIAGTLFLVWSNLLLARPLLRSRQLLFPDFGRLNEWKAPEALVWVAIALGFLLVVGQSVLAIIAVNGLIVMMMIYFFQGIAIVSFYFEKKQFPKPLRALLYGLIAMQQLLLVLVIAVGFFDIWIDFRRTRKVEE